MNPATPEQVISPPPKARDLTQQKDDFTAEGSPPPGMVGTALPETTDETVATAAIFEQGKPPTDTRVQPGAALTGER